MCELMESDMATQMVATKLTKDFWLLAGKLLYVQNNAFFEKLSGERSVEYALDICGEPVFDCEIEDDGDPMIETTATPIANDKLFTLLVEQLKNT